MVQPLFYGILGTQVNIASIDLNIVGKIYSQISNGTKFTYTGSLC